MDYYLFWTLFPLVLKLSQIWPARALWWTSSEKETRKKSQFPVTRNSRLILLCFLPWPLESTISPQSYSNFFLLKRVSCSPAWPQTCYIAKTSLKLLDSPASISQVLGSQKYAIVPGFMWYWRLNSGLLIWQTTELHLQLCEVIFSWKSYWETEIRH